MSKVWARTTDSTCFTGAVIAVKLLEVIVSWILISNLGKKGDNETVGKSALECN